LSSPANYPEGFLEECGAPPLPEDNPDDVDYNPGDDEGEYAPDTDPLPQVNAACNSTAEREPDHQNYQLSEQISDIVAHVEAIDVSMQANNIPSLPFYAAGVKVKGFDRDAITNVCGIISFLGAGSVLSSLDVDLEKDHQTYHIKGHAANEMGKASHLLPAKQIFRYNPTIFESIKQAVQVGLNETEVNDQDNPAMKGTGRPPKKTTGEVLPLYKLYLARQKTDLERNRGEDDDFWLLHKVNIVGPHALETVPAYVAICFFLEDIGDKQRSAKKKITHLLPDHTAAFSPGTFVFPGSPTLPLSPAAAGVAKSPNTKRHRKERKDNDSIAAVSEATSPGAPPRSTGGFFNLGRR